VSIYTESPYKAVSNTDEFDSDINGNVGAVYTGYTDGSGKLTKTISIPSFVTKLYIVPVTMGYGVMQEVSVSDLNKEIVLQGRIAQIRETKASTSDEPIVRDQILVGKNYKFYHYFTSDEFNSVDGTLNLNTGLVSYEKLSPEFLNYVNNYFPEKEQNYSGYEDDTDFKVTEENGAEIWVTYIGDGNFTQQEHRICNGLYYYVYTDKNKPEKPYSLNYLSKNDYVFTAAFPNVNPEYITPGTKVQLMYFNSETQKYQTTFPNGSYVGFALNHKGYNSSDNINGTLGFSLTQREKNPYCTSKKFNEDKRTHGIIHWDTGNNCYILGMERKGKDNDFNDLVVKIVCNPARLEQVGTVTPVGGNIVEYSREGVLAFEDNWPQKGDYDFNDFVTQYKYTFEKNENSNNITAVSLTFKALAIGAGNTNGFGIQLPINKSLIVNSGDYNIEADGDKSVVIIYDNVRKAFNNATGFINTTKGSRKLESKETTIRFEFSIPAYESLISFDNFNPFLYAKSREREIHLVDKKPTSKMDMTLFGSGDDKSSVEENHYYRMDNKNPWALDICDKNWRWPYEGLMNGIGMAYPKFSSWYTDWQMGGMINWESGANDEYLW
jgi:hypothetical protein